MMAAPDRELTGRLRQQSSELVGQAAALLTKLTCFVLRMYTSRKCCVYGLAKYDFRSLLAQFLDILRKKVAAKPSQVW